MSNFPLYDNLVKDIPKKDLTVQQKEEFISKVQDIDSKGRDLIFALIQFYRIENEDDKSSEDLPYKGIREENEKGLKNLTWSFTDFPLKLRHILHKFILIHVQSMEEEQARNGHII
jgi:hypothetical protein